jgi:hypothetical protein
LESAWVHALGQLRQIFRYESVWAATDAAPPRSVGKTAVTTPYQLTQLTQLTR